MADDTPKVAQFPQSAEARARTRRQVRPAVPSGARRTLGALAQAPVGGVLGVPRAAYFGAAIATAAMTVLEHREKSVPSWVAVGVLIVLGLI
jgi:hypothetical protein